MNNEQVMTILFVIGIGFGLFGRFLLDNIQTYWNKLVKIYKNNKDFKELQDSVDQMREKGEMHDWMEMNLGTTKALVCKKTGWCPSQGGFLPMSIINQYIENLKTEEEYQEFRNARVQLIAHENNLTVPATERVVEQVFAMKKDFFLQRISKLQQEMEQRAAEVLKEQENK